MGERTTGSVGSQSTCDESLGLACAKLVIVYVKAPKSGRRRATHRRQGCNLGRPDHAVRHCLSLQAANCFEKKRLLAVS
jgi:hypothetical protein